MVFNLIVASLATWRITHVISKGERIGQPVRRVFAGEKEDVAGLLEYSDSLLAELIMCFLCLSFWVGIFCTVMIFIFPYILYPFALSSIAIFMDKHYG